MSTEKSRVAYRLAIKHSCYIDIDIVRSSFAIKSVVTPTYKLYKNHAISCPVYSDKKVQYFTLDMRDKFSFLQYCHAENKWEFYHDDGTDDEAILGAIHTAFNQVDPDNLCRYYALTDRNDIYWIGATMDNKYNPNPNYYNSVNLRKKQISTYHSDNTIITSTMVYECDLIKKKKKGMVSDIVSEHVTDIIIPYKGLFAVVNSNSFADFIYFRLFADLHIKTYGVSAGHMTRFKNHIRAFNSVFEERGMLDFWKQRFHHQGNVVGMLKKAREIVGLCSKKDVRGSQVITILSLTKNHLIDELFYVYKTMLRNPSFIDDTILGKLLSKLSKKLKYLPVTRESMAKILSFNLRHYYKVLIVEYLRTRSYIMETYMNRLKKTDKQPFLLYSSILFLIEYIINE